MPASLQAKPKGPDRLYREQYLTNSNIFCLTKTNSCQGSYFEPSVFQSKNQCFILFAFAPIEHLVSRQFQPSCFYQQYCDFSIRISILGIKKRSPFGSFRRLLLLQFQVQIFGHIGSGNIDKVHRTWRAFITATGNISSRHQLGAGNCLCVAGMHPFISL